MNQRGLAEGVSANGAVLEFQAYLFQEKKLDAGTLQQHVAAVRSLYVKTLKRRAALLRAQR